MGAILADRIWPYSVIGPFCSILVITIFQGRFSYGVVNFYFGIWLNRIFDFRSIFTVSEKRRLSIQESGAIA